MLGMSVAVFHTRSDFCKQNITILKVCISLLDIPNLSRFRFYNDPEVIVNVAHRNERALRFGFEFFGLSGVNVTNASQQLGLQCKSSWISRISPAITRSNRNNRSIVTCGFS